MLTTAALSDGYAVAAATAKADRVGVCVAKGSAPHALWSRLIDQVAERSALYCLLTSSVGHSDLTAIHARCHRAFKAKAGLCVTTPNAIVSSLVTMDWANKHFMEQLLMVIKHLQRPSTTLHALLASSIQQHALWQGGDSTLGALSPVTDRWDGTMLGRLHLWMSSLHLELRGPLRVPPARENDTLLRHLALDSEERETLAAGSWIAEAWRVADCTWMTRSSSLLLLAGSGRRRLTQSLLDWVLLGSA